MDLNVIKQASWKCKNKQQPTGGGNKKQLILETFSR